MKDNTSENKKKIAKAIKSMFDYLASAEDSNSKTFNVNINNQQYDNIDIAKIVSTFSDTLVDGKEPQLEILNATEGEPLPRDKENKNIEVAQSKSKKEIQWLSYLQDRHGYFYHDSDQLAKETHILYIKICRLINRKYVKRGESFRQIANKYMNDFFYANPYVSIYRIAQQYILSYYRYGRLPERYYELNTIGDYFDKSIEKAVVRFINEHVTMLSAPTPETLKALGLTAYGTAPVWWDDDGTLRAKDIFTKEQVKLLNISEKRTTKLWKVPEIRLLMLKTYLEIYQQLNKMMQDKPTAETVNAYILGPPHDKNPFIRGYINKTLYASNEWLRVVESKFRDKLPKLKPLDEDKTWYALSYKFPIELIDDISRSIDMTLDSMPELDFITMCEGYLTVNPDDWSFAGLYIVSLSPPKAIDVLIKHQSHDLITKIAGKVIKSTQNPDVLRPALYLKARDKLVKSEEKVLKSLIYEGNLAQFNALVKADVKMDENLVQKLSALKLPIRKTIALSEHKLGHAKVTLKKTTEIVEEYLGDEVVAETIIVEQPNLAFAQIESTKNGPLIDFLVELSTGNLSEQQAKPFAENYGKSVSMMIDDINQKFYELIEDQIIVQNDNQISIDEFYLDDVKAYINKE